MKKQLLAIVIAAGVSGCAGINGPNGFACASRTLIPCEGWTYGPEAAVQRHSKTCINMGYESGTEPFLQCFDVVSNRAAQTQAVEQQDRAARMGVIGAYLNNQRPQPMPIMPFQQQQRVSCTHRTYGGDTLYTDCR